MTVEQIRADREAREARAAERAKKLRDDREYYAYDNHVMCRTICDDEAVIECETHWDACLVLLAQYDASKFYRTNFDGKHETLTPE